MGTRYAKKGFHNSGEGLVNKGDPLDVSDQTARELEEKGLIYAEGEEDTEVVEKAKQAREAKNKQAPPHRTQALPDASGNDSDGVVRSTANDLGAGGGRSATRGETTLGSSHAATSHAAPKRK